MDLSTRYLGLELPHPIIPGASPLALDIDNARLLEDSGAAALVLPSLFEEQIREELRKPDAPASPHGHFHARIASTKQQRVDGRLGPDEYLDQISRISERVGIPVIASINGVTPGGWLWAGALMEQAGADALELNIYEVAADPEESGQDVEDRVLQTVAAMASRVSIPIAVKLSPYYSSLAHFAHGLERAGARGLVLFNRFLQADIDPDVPGLSPSIHPSTPHELLERLRWTAILSPKLKLDFAVTGGVHSARDVAKSLLAGADVVQVVSSILVNGTRHVGALVSDLIQWMEENDYESLDSVRGRLSMQRCPDEKAYARVQYSEVLKSWRPWT